MKSALPSGDRKIPEHALAKETIPESNPFRRTVLILASLTKCRIAILAAATAATGYLLGADMWSPQLLYPALGVFLLAAGAGTLNNVQDLHVDRIAPRTRARPLPQGDVSQRFGIAIALALMACGSCVLGLAPTRPGTGVALGLMAVGLYNGLYAWLKRRTAFAAIPGACVGMVPPVIGWTMAGAPLADPHLAPVAVFYFLWQVPHFWLYLVVNRGDYKATGLPLATERIHRDALVRIAGLWTLATSAAGVIAMAAFTRAAVLTLPMVLSAVAAFGTLVWLLLPSRQPHPLRLVFTALNVYVLIATLLLGLTALVPTA